MAILKQGQRIGKYGVQYVIKQNAYAESYRVTDEDDTPYFLKLYIIKNTPEKLLGEDGMPGEITYARQLRHANIISFIESGTEETEEGKVQWMVTTWFSGQMLSEHIQTQGRLPLEEATAIFEGILNGLQHLHKQTPPLLFNDLTPSNIMLSERTDGVPEIIDMGHVSHYCAGRPSFDTTDMDPRYQANETFTGIYEEEGDIFSATAVFYAMLFGHAPWDVTFAEGATRAQRIEQVKKKRKEEALSLDGAELPQGIQNILRRGLALKSKDRYGSVKALLNDLHNPDEAKEPATVKSEGAQQRGQAMPTGGEQAHRNEEPTTDVEIKKGQGGGFADIAGMQELKDMLMQKVIFVLKNAEKAKAYRLTPPNGMLLYGPPGCGKSFFAEKFAEETGFSFCFVKASDLGSSFIHGSQSKIADLFKKAEKSAPTVLCFDEFDALVPDRSNDSSHHQSGEVNEMLSQLNNCAKRGIFVIATSNRPDKIDPAILRTGRIDKMVYVPLPDLVARREMLALHLKDRPCEALDMEELARMTEGYVASDIAYVVNDSAMVAAFSDRPITQDILRNTIQSVHPSVRKDTLRLYEGIRQRLDDINQRNSLPHIGFV